MISFESKFALLKHAQLQTFQYRELKTQMPHELQYDYHHKLPSFLVASILALGQQYVQSPDARQIQDNNGHQNLLRFYLMLQLECGFPHSQCLLHDLALWAHYGQEQLLSYLALSLSYQMYVILQKPVGLLLREPDGDLCIANKFHQHLHGQHEHPIFCHKVS